MNSNIREEKLQILKSNIQLLYEQRILLNLLNSNGIPTVVIGDSLTALSYPNPVLRELHDIDLILQGEFFKKAVSLCKQDGYLPFKLPEDQGNCAHFIRNSITIHLITEVRVFSDEQKNQLLNTWIASGKPLTASIGNDTINTLQQWLNGILQLALLQADAQRGRIKMQSLTDWMMFAKNYLCDENWGSFAEKADQFELKEFAKSITCFGKKYIDINATWCDGTSDKFSNLVVLDTRRPPSRIDTVNTGGLVRKVKLTIRFLYRMIKQSLLRSIFYVNFLDN